MQPYTTTTRQNFISHKQYDINELDLSKYAHVVSTFKSLGALFGVSTDECIEACKALKIRNSSLIDIDYSPPGSTWGALLEDKAAQRRVKEGKRDEYRIDNYSSYVVTYQYASVVEGEIIRYFLEQKYPHIFCHPDFFRKKRVEVDGRELPLSEFIREYGDMTICEATRRASEFATIEREITASKFVIYATRGADDYEIYLETASGNLYVPLRAIVERDFSLVYQRMRSYFSWYCKDKPQQLREALAPLDSPEAALLKQLLLI